MTMRKTRLFPRFLHRNLASGGILSPSTTMTTTSTTALTRQSVSSHFIHDTSNSNGQVGWRQSRPRRMDSSIKLQQHVSTSYLSSLSSPSVSTSVPTLTADFAPSSLWEDLRRAVERGDGTNAEEIADQMLQDHQRQHNLAAVTRSSTSSSAWSSTLDGRIFSCVLQAWKKHILMHVSPTSGVDGSGGGGEEQQSLASYIEEMAKRSHKLLEQMEELAQQDILLTHPSLEDSLVVLQCWQEVAAAAAAAENDKRKQTKLISNNAMEQAEAIWQRLDKEAMWDVEDASVDSENGNFLLHRSKREVVLQLYQAMLSLLENVGQASRAEEILNEALEYCATSRLANASSNSLWLDMCRSVLRAHARSPETRAAPRAQDFVRRMLDDPNLPSPDTACYNDVIQYWTSIGGGRKSQQDRILVAEKVETLLKEMKKARLRPDLTTYTHVINALANAGEAVRAEKALTGLVKDYTDQFDASLKPDARPFEAVLWAYSISPQGGDAKTAERAESLVRNMRELYECGLLETKPSVWCYNICLKIWSQSKAPDAMDRAKELYDRMLESKSIHSDDNKKNIAIVEYNRVGWTENSTQIANDNRHANAASPDTISMNTVLQASSRRQKADQTEKLLWKFLDDHKQDPSTNPCPDVISFSLVMASWSKSRNFDAPERAERLLQQMEYLYESGLDSCQPDLICYATVMQAWANSKRPDAPEKAEDILRHLQSAYRMIPDAACWNSAIAACGMAGQGERAEALFCEMLELHQNNPSMAAVPNDISFANVCNGWAKTRDPSAADRAIQLLREVEELCKQGVLPFKPHVVHYTSVIDCLAYARRTETAELAESMLREMSTSNDPNVKPNTISYNCVIKAWSFTRSPEAVARVTALMKEMIQRYESGEGKQLRPNGNTFGSVLHTLANSRLEDKDRQATEVVALMERFDCQLDTWCKKELERCQKRRGNTNFDKRGNPSSGQDNDNKSKSNKNRGNRKPHIGTSNKP